MAGASGKKLDDTYKLAWLRGLKTTYYLRTIGATHVEKSTVSRGTLNAVSSGSDVGGVSAAGAAPAAPASALDAAAATAQAMPEAEGAVCTMRPGDPGFEECEACQ